MFNIRKLFQDYNIPHADKGSNLSHGWVSTDCPYCGSTKGHFAINPYNKQANCWRCGGHHLSHALTIILCVSDSQIYSIMREYDNDNTIIEKPVEPSNEVDYVKLGVMCKKQHADYLYSRGFDAVEIINKYKLRGTVTMYGWENRLVIPIFYKGKEVCYQTRSINPDEELRYKGCSRAKSIIHYKDMLYPVLDTDWVVVVEGIFDMWRLGKNSVCTFGTTLSLRQITLLSNYKRVLFAFDPSDDNAQARAIKYCNMLQMMGCKARRLQIETERNDPGEFTQDEVSEFWGIIEKL